MSSSNVIASGLLSTINISRLRGVDEAVGRAVAKCRQDLLQGGTRASSKEGCNVAFNVEPKPIVPSALPPKGKEMHRTLTAALASFTPMLAELQHAHRDLNDSGLTGQPAVALPEPPRGRLGGWRERLHMTTSAKWLRKDTVRTFALLIRDTFFMAARFYEIDAGQLPAAPSELELWTGDLGDGFIRMATALSELKPLILAKERPGSERLPPAQQPLLAFQLRESDEFEVQAAASEHEEDIQRTSYSEAYFYFGNGPTEADGIHHVTPLVGWTSTRHNGEELRQDPISSLSTTFSGRHGLTVERTGPGTFVVRA